MNKQIILIDTNSFIHRAYHAVKSLAANDGTPTNAIYGTVQMLKQIKNKFNTELITCVIDAKGKNFRHDIYPEYKANRDKTPDDLIIQIEKIKHIINLLGFPLIIENGVEADDVISTIAKKYSQLDYKVVIVTSDKDFAQVVDSNISLFNTATDEMLDENGVLEKYKIKPNQFADYLALIGDASDNIKGIEKCGKVTAVKWLYSFLNLDNIIANKDKITGKVGDNLRNSIDQLNLARKLVAVDCNVDIKTFNINDLNNLKISEPKFEELIQIYTQLNFRSLLSDLYKKVNKENDIKINTFTNSPITEELVEIKTSNKANYVGSLNEIITEVLKSKSKNTAILLINDTQNDLSSKISYVLIENDLIKYIAKTNDLNDDNLKNELGRYFNSDLVKISANLSVLYKQIQKLGIYNTNYILNGDLSLLEYACNSNNNKSDLVYIINKIYNKNTLSFKDFFGKNLVSEIESESAISYLSSIMEILDSHTYLLNKLNQKKQELYFQTDLILAKILHEMSVNGIKIDLNKLSDISDLINKEMKDVEKSIYDVTGEFNLNSPKQLQTVLFEQMKLSSKGVRKTNYGFSTDEDVLLKLSDDGYTVADSLLRYRHLNKLLNTYVDKLPKEVDLNNFVHTTYNQSQTTTGRLSSKDPNLQNIPIKYKLGQKIRECFIASDENHTLISADYSQIELRVLAYICKDENLIQAFNNNEDIHLSTAKRIFNKDESQVTNEERRYAKSINFGLIYGKSVFSLAKELKISRAAAKHYVDSYFSQYPKVGVYMSSAKQYAHDNGCVPTIYGRDIILSKINSKNHLERSEAERLALNAPIQGSAADIIKIAMINVYNWLKQNNLKTQMILQVHDELVFNVPNNELEFVLNNLKHVMEDCIKTNDVKMAVNLNYGSNWNVAH